MTGDGLAGRYWVPDESVPLLPLDGVRLFRLRSIETGEEAIIAVPPPDGAQRRESASR